MFTKQRLAHAAIKIAIGAVGSALVGYTIKGERALKEYIDLRFFAAEAANIIPKK